MKTILFPHKPAPDPELPILRAELSAAQNDLQQAYCRFDQALDPELVESCIYEIDAIKARCNYLIRVIKKRCPAAAIKEDTTWG
jgi:hypothetical protein